MDLLNECAIEHTQFAQNALSIKWSVIVLCYCLPRHVEKCLVGLGKIRVWFLSTNIGLIEIDR